MAVDCVEIAFDELEKEFCGSYPGVKQRATLDPTFEPKSWPWANLTRSIAHPKSYLSLPGQRADPLEDFQLANQG